MADQDFRMFEDARYQKLGVDKVRFLVPYDWFKKQGNEDEVKAFMERAAASDTDVLVHFTARRGCYANGRYSKRKVCKAPSVKQYKKNVKRFIKEFPETREIGVWNEGNHVSQPTYNKPGLAAKYFLAARSVCKGCKIVAADVLDSSNMERWLSGFDRKDKGKARIYGLHNYSDVNRKRQSGTTRLLRKVGGEVLADGDRRHPEVPAAVPALREAPGVRDEVHVQAREPLRHAPLGHALPHLPALQLPVDGRREERALRRGPRRPDGQAAQGLQGVQEARGAARLDVVSQAGPPRLARGGRARLPGSVPGHRPGHASHPGRRRRARDGDLEPGQAALPRAGGDEDRPGPATTSRSRSR